MASSTVSAKVLSVDVLSICTDNGYLSPYNYDLVDTMNIQSLLSERRKAARYIKEGTRYDYDKVLFIDQIVAINKITGKSLKEQPSIEFICNDAFSYEEASAYLALITSSLEEKYSIQKQALEKKIRIRDTQDFLVTAMNSCKKNGMYDGHASLSKISKSDILFQTNIGATKLTEDTILIYSGYEDNEEKHYEVCKYIASIINKEKYVLSPQEVLNQREIAAKALADKKAQKDAQILADKKAEAIAKAEALQIAAEVEREKERVTSIKNEINMLSEELRSIENKINRITPRASFVLVKSKMDNGAVQAIVNSELVAIIDPNGVITKPGQINLHLVKMKSLYTRKESGFDIPVTTYGINVDPERALREYKTSPEGIVNLKRAEEIKSNILVLRSEL